MHIPENMNKNTSPNACSDFFWDRHSGGAGRAAKPLTSGFQIFENGSLNCCQIKREIRKDPDTKVKVFKQDMANSNDKNL